MLDTLLAVIPAALAGSAILAFFWTLVMRINELENRTVSTMSAMSESSGFQEAVQQELRGAEAVRQALSKRISSTEEARRSDAERLQELSRALEENSVRQSRAVESMAAILTKMHAQMSEQEERLSALVDLRLTKAALETADDLRRLEMAIQHQNQSATAQVDANSAVAASA
jgi:hypothetical protein